MIGVTLCYTWITWVRFMDPGLEPVLPSGRLSQKNIYISPGSGSLVGDKNTKFVVYLLKKKCIEFFCPKSSSHPRISAFLFFPLDPGQWRALAKKFGDERCELLFPAFRSLMKSPSLLQGLPDMFSKTHIVKKSIGRKQTFCSLVLTG